MQKESELWTIDDVAQRFSRISFPEYQREPNVWSRSAKQRLIDSISREFDISSIYLYEDEDGNLDCIDGRQRLGAIMSFLCDNPEDEDNRFLYRRMNEIFNDDVEPFEEIEGLNYEEIQERATAGLEVAERFVTLFRNYALSIVRLSGSRRPEEFNLQFTRLNLGTIINSGEKLHAMVGDLRDICFEEIGHHAFLEGISIPTRRYAQEQVAAQILAQIFSLAEGNGYTRMRHFDLQRLFKEHTTLDELHQEVVERVRDILDLLDEAFRDAGVLRNRALTVSTVILAWELEIEDDEEAKDLSAFIDEFACRLKWQVGKGLDFDSEYRYLVDFQRDVAQASVERTAVERRALELRTQFDRWLETGELLGDAEYQGNASEDCRADN